uniref:Uncharacterized protein n=1 Tax=Chenopodium quinoa TaxID=63459 RepID=A0A803MCU0_CHEQI
MSQAESSLWSFRWNTSNETDEAFQNMLTIIIPLFFITWFIFFIKWQNKKRFPLPPGPRGLPLVGYLPFLDSNLHQSFINLASIYGPIFKVQLGMKDCIVITSPSLVKEVVRDHDVIFANRGDPTVAVESFMLGTDDIAFSNYGHEWRKMRKLFCQQTGHVVDVGELIFLTIVNSLMSMMWGDTLKGGEVNAEFRALITELMEHMGAPNISDMFPFLARFDLQGIERRMKIISSYCESIFDSAINHHANEETNKQKDFLGHLLQLTKFDHPTSLTLPQVKAMLMDTLIGGTDTTASMVEWAMAEVLQHVEVMRKVQEELTEIVGLNSTVEEVHLPKLKYLNAVVKETLRLHPPLALLVPHSPKLRDPNFWEDPLLFKPERFLSGSAAEKMDYLGNYFQYLPFGSGRRMCAGVSLAERTAMLVLASLLHAFQWKLPNGSVEVDTSERFGIVVKKAKPLLAFPSPRLSSLELYSLEY